MTASNDDLNRSLGRLEGDVSAVKERMDRLERVVTEGMTDIKQAMVTMQADIAEIKARENERKGAWKALAFIAGMAGAAFSGLAGYLLEKFG